MMSNQDIIYRYSTVLILDSGVGGLFFYETVRRIVPFVNYLYLIDNKCFPYGNCSEKFIIQRVILIIERICRFLKFDLVVIACNTISVVALSILQINFRFPIIGVVPEIQLACQCTKNGVVGILGTCRTVNNKYIFNSIKRFAYKKNIVLLGTSRLVELAESKVYGNLVSKLELIDILNPWLNLKKIPDTIVLGCTHFSWLKSELQSVLPVDSCLIDSSNRLINHIKYLLNSRCLKKKNKCYFDVLLYQNKAYYTMHTADIVKLRSILLFNYNFFSLEMLPI
ncbi:glutamate racemase [Candidatus Blochmanniella vafra str. BVAF]|uniref:Glutamate racemase n=1 Tax=Blochmanniella vafra (strain BVAF) TaxID=859654 RepID=E8Q6K1_BLOVB|nr:glutamate racemase [Candidatus Blochmannia vafer]ADV33970.1 glutamate racemase [Candidatus Blochmannia vafer str. BVAF]